MSNVLICPGCSTRLRLRKSAAKAGKCPRCRTAITIVAPIGPSASAAGPKSRRDIPKAIPAGKPVRRFRSKALVFCAMLLLVPAGLTFVLAGLGNLYFGSEVPAPVAWNTEAAPFEDKVAEETKAEPAPLVSEAPVPEPQSQTQPAPAPAPPIDPGPVNIQLPVTPAASPAPPPIDQRRQFLQLEIARLQAAIRQDEDLLTRQSVGAPAIRIGAQIFAALLQNSSNEFDQRAAPYVAPVLPQVGNEVGGMVDRARAETEARLRENRRLLLQYQTELNQLGLGPV